MKQNFKKLWKGLLGLALAAALILPALNVNTTDAYARSNVKLSSTYLYMDDADSTYTLKIKNTRSRDKVSWSVYDDGDDDSISWSYKNRKRTIVITPEQNGSGRIICKVGKKKYTCRYEVDIDYYSLYTSQDSEIYMQQGDTFTVPITYTGWVDSDNEANVDNEDDSVVSTEWDDDDPDDSYTCNLYLKAENPGTTTITVTGDGTDDEVTLRVNVISDDDDDDYYGDDDDNYYGNDEDDDDDYEYEYEDDDDDDYLFD